MAIQTAAKKESQALAYTSDAAYASLHTAAPGSTGTGELTGGGYARQPLSWAAGTVDGQVSASVSFSVPEDVTILGVGLWTAVTGGTYLDAIDTNVGFASAGIYQVTLTVIQN